MLIIFFSFKLYQKNDFSLENEVWKYDAPLLPKKPNYKNIAKDKIERKKNIYKDKLKNYNDSLLPKFFKDSNLMLFPEGVEPNCIMVCIFIYIVSRMIQIWALAN